MLVSPPLARLLRWAAALLIAHGIEEYATGFQRVNWVVVLPARYFARAEDGIFTVSTFGAYLDLTADKVLVATFLCILLARGALPIWIVLSVLVREFAVMGMRGFASAEHASIPPSIGGGVKIIATYLAMGASALSMAQARWLWAAVAILTILSGVHYAFSARRVLARYLYYPSPALAHDPAVGSDV